MQVNKCRERKTAEKPLNRQKSTFSVAIQHPQARTNLQFHVTLPCVHIHNK